MFMLKCHFLTVTLKSGMKFTLASAKVDRNKSRGRHHFVKEKDIKLLYIQSRYLASDLEKFCSFSLMKPEKVVARLGELGLIYCHYSVYD